MFVFEVAMETAFQDDVYKFLREKAKSVTISELHQHFMIPRTDIHLSLLKLIDQKMIRRFQSKGLPRYTALAPGQKKEYLWNPPGYTPPTLDPKEVEVTLANGIRNSIRQALIASPGCTLLELSQKVVLPKVQLVNNLGSMVSQGYVRVEGGHGGRDIYRRRYFLVKEN